MTAAPRLDIAEVRRRLAGTSGHRFWMGLEEIVDDVRFGDWLKAEFPAAARLFAEQDRRAFLKVMGASLLLAGLAGCGEERSDLALPYVNQPEAMTPGVPRHYASAVCLEGFAQPVLATTYDGRPTKLDGNPDHPVTRGRSDAFMQAAILQLYDPDRSQAPAHRGTPSTWAAFERDLAEMRRHWMDAKGDGLRLLIGDVTSPTLIRQLALLTAQLPACRLHRFEPVGAAHRREAIRLAFGRDLDLHYRLENCDVIVSIEDDLLGPGPEQVLHARAWSSGRGDASGRQLRLHVAECTPTPTGTVAQTRVPIDLSRIPNLVSALAAGLGVTAPGPANLADNERAWVERTVHELSDHGGRSLLALGKFLPAAIQAQAFLINERLGNVGQTLWYSEPVALAGDNIGTLSELAQNIGAGKVQSLVLFDANPAYASPGELGFADLLAGVKQSIHAGLHRDETAALCTWHVPLTHPLESWSDVRAIDGTATIIQPVVAPFYSVRTAHQVMELLLGNAGPAADVPVRATWQQTFDRDFDAKWQQSLRDGLVADTAVAPVSVTARPVDWPAEYPRGDAAIDVAFRPDPTIWDGRFANVAWLQELPKPLSKLTWDNVVGVSPRVAEQLGIANGDRVTITVAERTAAGPAWIVPGQATNTIALYLGYGRRQAGRVGSDIGYDAYLVQPSADPWHAVGTIQRAMGRETLATTQLNHRMDGFDFVREVTPSRPSLPAAEPPPTLYPQYPSPGHAWGMVIDLDLCIGCNACVSACTAENNVAVVGKEQVAMGRDMQWIRVDRYYTGDIENPRSYFQPVPCMQCEKAPCEMGCPVHATMHSPEGLNEQVYNRCIGTRTCSSYCPYKVRRFNWFDYRAPADSSTHAAHNPEVTVRSRGVMEKCTYCTQRIEAARANADKEGRDIRSGEVVTACQAACPTTAIAFGDLNDPQSEVAKRRKSGRHYVLLEELGTRPRTTYLARWKSEDA